MKSLLLLAAALLFLSGCCCVASGPACATYSQSCEKSCAFQGSPSGCVESCKSMFSQGGVDPDSCCPDSMKVRNTFEYVCPMEADTFSSTEECVNYMVSEYQSETGLGPEDCTIGA